MQGEEDANPVAATVDAEGNFVREDVPLAEGANAITVNVTDKYGRTTSDVRNVTLAAAPTFSYDANGSLTGDGTFTYTWNQENRLVAVDWETEAANLHLAYKYDGLGRRREVAKSGTLKVGGSISPQVIRFVYDGNNLVAELDGQDEDAILRKYVWGLDLSGTMSGAAGVGGLLAVSDGTSTHYPTYDANGNITAYLDASDNAVYTAEYSPFGKITATTGTAPAQFGFSTIYCDEETGFLAYRFRDYDPNLGRWPTRDPLGENGGVNLYAMVGNDPVGRWDLLGLSFIPDIGYDSAAYVKKRTRTGWGYTTPYGLAPVWMGEDDIQESGSGTKCCAEVKKAQDVEYSPETRIAYKSEIVGTEVTEAYYTFLHGHENRRMTYHRWAYYRYYNPSANDNWAAVRCGKVCYVTKGTAKKKLQQYLSDLRTAAKDQAKSYKKLAESIISEENEHTRQNSSGLWDTSIVNIVPDPNPFKPPVCPTGD